MLGIRHFNSPGKPAVFSWWQLGATDQSGAKSNPMLERSGERFG